MFHRYLSSLVLLVILLHAPVLAHAQAAATPTPAPIQQEKEMEWDAGVGLSAYNSEMKSGCWYPVWIEIQANKTGVKGVATISQGLNPLRVEVPVEVVKGTRKRYRTYFQTYAQDRLLQTEINVQLQSESVGTASFPIQIRYSPAGTRHILVLCDQDGAFNFLNRRADRDNAQVLGQQSVIYSRPELIPEDSVALSSLDAMIIDTGKVRQLSAAQWTAIRGWVAQGGKLLLGAGRNQPFIEQSPLKKPYGVSLAEAEPVAAPTIFGNAAQTTQSQADTMLVSWPVAPAGGWDAIWAGDAQHPFLAGKRVGRGWFCLCAAALDPVVIDRLRKHSVATDNSLACIEQAATFSPMEAYAAKMERDLGMSLQRGFAINLADIGWVLLYLALYNVLAMPVNWWICRRIGHPALAWPILILMAVGFTWYGYRYSMERQQQNFQVNEVTFISRPAEDSAAHAVSLTTLFTPNRINRDITATGMEFLNRLALTERDNETPLTLGFDQSVTARKVLMYPWTVFNVRGEFSMQISGSVKADQPIETGPVEFFADLGPLTLTNQTKHTFTHWWLRQGNRVWAGAQPLAAGRTLQLDRLSCTKRAFDPGSIIFPTIDARFPNESRPIGQPPLPATMSYAQPSSKYTAYAAYGMRSEPEMSDSLAVQSRRMASDDRLYFIGEASGICSPFSQPFASQKQIGCIFYEQILPQRELSNDAQAAWQPGNWIAQVIKIGKESVALTGIPANGSTNARLAFPLNSVVIAFTPERSRKQAQPAGMIELAYSFTNYPDHERRWPFGANQYVMLGCPVEAYNFKLKNWVALQPTSRGTLALTPTEDYLKPMESTFYLRLNAVPDEVHFIKQPPSSTQSGEMITGKQLLTPLYGTQWPVTLGDMNSSQPYYQMGNQFPNPIQPPKAAELVGLKVSQNGPPAR